MLCHSNLSPLLARVLFCTFIEGVDEDETDQLRKMLILQGIPSPEKKPTYVKDEALTGVRLKVTKLPSFSGDKNSRDATFAR